MERSPWYKVWLRNVPRPGSLHAEHAAVRREDFNNCDLDWSGISAWWSWGDHEPPIEGMSVVDPGEVWDLFLLFFVPSCLKNEVGRAD